MSANCLIQNCSQGCCNIDGICPTSFGSYYQQNCYYYYGYYIWAYWWIYFVIVVGSLLCLAICIAICVACCRRRRAYNQDTIIINSQPTPSYTYEMQNKYSRQPVMGQPVMGQPVMGQPVYLAGNTNMPIMQGQDPIYY